MAVLSVVRVCNQMFDHNQLSPALLRAFEYWRSKSIPNGIPGRQDIDPLDIPSLLPWISLTDIDRSDGQPKFKSRLVGTGIVAQFGRDITGKSAEELYDQAYTQELEARYLRVIETNEPDQWQREIADSYGDTISYVRLILPLARDHQTADMLMNVFDFGQRLSTGPIPPGWSEEAFD